MFYFCKLNVFLQHYFPVLFCTFSTLQNNCSSYRPCDLKTISWFGFQVSLVGHVSASFAAFTLFLQFWKKKRDLQSSSSSNFFSIYLPRNIYMKMTPKFVSLAYLAPRTAGSNIQPPTQHLHTDVKYTSPISLLAVCSKSNSWFHFAQSFSDLSKRQLHQSSYVGQNPQSHLWFLFLSLFPLSNPSVNPINSTFEVYPQSDNSSPLSLLPFWSTYCSSHLDHWKWPTHWRLHYLPLNSFCLISKTAKNIPVKIKGKLCYSSALNTPIAS